VSESDKNRNSSRAEIDAYSRQLHWILDQIIVSLQGLTARQLNWRPSTQAANSAYAIATHVVGSTRVYALSFGCGVSVERDREAEFRASGDDFNVLVARISQLSAEIQAALNMLKPTALEERISPPQQLWGTGAPHEFSRRDALIESVRHAGIHLGELRLTRDLATQQV